MTPGGTAIPTTIEQGIPQGTCASSAAGSARSCSTHACSRPGGSLITQASSRPSNGLIRDLHNELHASAGGGGIGGRAPEPTPLSTPASSGSQPRRESGSASRLPRPATATPTAGRDKHSSSGSAVERPRFDMKCRGEGWHPHAGSSEQQCCRNPILHTVEAYQRRSDGRIARCEGTLRDSRQGAGMPSRPASRGRQKGLAEFADLCNKGRSNRNPAHAAALAKDRHAFHIRKTDLHPQVRDTRAACGFHVARSAPASRGAVQRPTSAPAVARRPVAVCAG